MVTQTDTTYKIWAWSTNSDTSIPLNPDLLTPDVQQYLKDGQWDLASLVLSEQSGLRVTIEVVHKVTSTPPEGETS